jgi:hypothetical protein
VEKEKVESQKEKNQKGKIEKTRHENSQDYNIISVQLLHLCTIKSPILGRFTSAKATVTMRILNAQRCKHFLNSNADFYKKLKYK